MRFPRLNWDQTGVLIIPTGDWTMAEERTSAVYRDDKRQLTAVLAAAAVGEYTAPQLLYKRKNKVPSTCKFSRWKGRLAQ